MSGPEKGNGRNHSDDDQVVAVSQSALLTMIQDAHERAAAEGRTGSITLHYHRGLLRKIEHYAVQNVKDDALDGNSGGRVE